MARNCSDCRYWRPGPADRPSVKKSDDLGSCHLNPPQMVVVPKTGSSGYEWRIDSYFPLARKTQHCAKWEKYPEAVDRRKYWA